MPDTLKMRGAMPWRWRQEQVQWRQEFNYLKILDISLMSQVFFDKKTILL
jgi:hypothetical protein